MNIIINEDIFYDLLEREKRRVKIQYGEVAWFKDFDKFIRNGDIPMTKNIVECLYGNLPMNAFHNTEINKLDLINKIRNKENAISVFRYMETDLLRNVQGVQTRGGVCLHVTGNLVFDATSDIMSQPDEFGRRWVSPSYFGTEIRTKINKLVSSNPKYLNAYEYHKGNKNKLYRIVIEYTNDCYNIIKNLSYNLLYHYYYEDRIEIGDSWSEGLMSNIKVNDVLLAVWKLGNYEDWKFYKNKKSDDLNDDEKMVVERFERNLKQIEDKLKSLTDGQVILSENPWDAVNFVTKRGGFTDVALYRKNTTIYFDDLPEKQQLDIINFKIKNGQSLTIQQFKKIDRESKLKLISRDGGYTLSKGHFDLLDDELKKTYIINEGFRTIDEEILEGLDTELQKIYVNSVIKNNYNIGELIDLLKPEIKSYYVEYFIKSKSKIIDTESLDYETLKNLSDDIKKLYLTKYFGVLSEDELSLFDENDLSIYFDKILDIKNSHLSESKLFKYFNDEQKLKYIKIGFKLNDESFVLIDDNLRKEYLKNALGRKHITLTEKQLMYLDNDQIIDYYIYHKLLPISVVNKLTPENRIKYLNFKIDSRMYINSDEEKMIFSNESLFESYSKKYPVSIDIDTLEKFSPTFIKSYILGKKVRGKIASITIDEFKLCDLETKKLLLDGSHIFEEFYLRDEDSSLKILNILGKVARGYKLSDENYSLLDFDGKKKYLLLKYAITKNQISETPEELLKMYCDLYYTPHKRDIIFHVELMKYIDDSRLDELISAGLVSGPAIEALPPEKKLVYYKFLVEKRRQIIPIDILIQLPLSTQAFYFRYVTIIMDAVSVSKLSDEAKNERFKVKIDKGAKLTDEEFLSVSDDVKSNYIDLHYESMTPTQIDSLTGPLKSKYYAKVYKGGRTLSDDELTFLDKDKKLSYLAKTDEFGDESYNKLDTKEKIAFVSSRLSKGLNITKLQFDDFPKRLLTAILSIGVKTDKDVFSYLTDDEKNYLIDVKLKKGLKLEPHELEYYKSKTGDMKEIVSEEEFRFDELSSTEKERIYSIFRDAYLKSTGTAWSKDKFYSRARSWTFYGLKDKGFVAVRKQRDNLNKLNGSAGEFSGIGVGMRELLSLNEPVWGAAPEKLNSTLCKRFGFIKPPAAVVKIMMQHIPKSVFGTDSLTVQDDGGITIDYSDVGTHTKYFYANDVYFKKVLPKMIENLDDSSSLNKIIKKSSKNPDFLKMVPDEFITTALDSYKGTLPITKEEILEIIQFLRKVM